MVLEWLQRYDSIEQQQNAEEYIVLHTSIKGIQVSHVFSALGLLIKGFSKLFRYSFLNATPVSRIFKTSALLGVSMSLGMTYNRS